LVTVVRTKIVTFKHVDPLLELEDVPIKTRLLLLDFAAAFCTQLNGSAKDLNGQIAPPISPNMIPTNDAIDGAVKANKLVRADRVFAFVLVIRWRVSQL